MDKQSSTLQQRIERTAGKLAALKAQQQAKEAREKTRRIRETRAARTRALVLWGVALEREALDAPEGIGTIRAILQKHLTRENERDVALAFLDLISQDTSVAGQ